MFSPTRFVGVRSGAVSILSLSVTIRRNSAEFASTARDLSAPAGDEPGMAGPEDEVEHEDFMREEDTYWRFDEDERLDAAWTRDTLAELFDGDEDRLAEAHDEIRRSTR